MDLTRLARWRTYAGRVGALFALLGMLSVVDGLISQFREPADLIRALPGDTVDVNGPLRQKVQVLQELTYSTDSEYLSLSFVALHRGYFLGGDMWRGRLTVSPRTPPGEYRLSVSVWGRPAAAPPLTFRIVVYRNPASLHEQAKSLWRRYTGLSPWLAAASMLPGIILAFGAVFLLSQKMEALLLKMGRAEVYRVVKSKGGYLVSFGLGAAQGLHSGATLTLFDAEGHPVGLVEVLEVLDTAATGRVSSDREIKPGFIVAR